MYRIISIHPLWSTYAFVSATLVIDMCGWKVLPRHQRTGAVDAGAPCKCANYGRPNHIRYQRDGVSWLARVAGQSVVITCASKWSACIYSREGGHGSSTNGGACMNNQRWRAGRGSSTHGGACLNIHHCQEPSS